MTLEDKHIKFISDSLKRYPDTCDVLDLFKSKFKVDYNTIGRRKLRDNIGQIRNRISKGIPLPSHILSGAPKVRYPTIRTFTDEQMDILTSKTMDHEKLIAWCTKYPNEAPVSLSAFYIWIRAAKNRTDREECKRVEDEIIAKQKVTAQPIMIPARIIHKCDKKPPTAFADEGEILTKILNSDIEIAHILSDVLSELRQQTTLSQKILNEFTLAKDLNQKKLDMIKELK